MINNPTKFIITISNFFVCILLFFLIIIIINHYKSIGELESMSAASYVILGIVCIGMHVGFYFLNWFPPLWVYTLIGLMDVIISIGTFICQNIEFSKPNEWLLVIKNGKLVKSGVGIYGFKGFNSSIVKYPSQMQTVRMIPPSAAFLPFSTPDSQFFFFLPPPFLLAAIFFYFSL